MERINAILNYPIFIKTMTRLNKLEADRLFCKHGMEHLLDVARIAYILNLESEEKPLPKDIIYAAALLHDIGRARQYEDGTPHEKESAKLAENILPDCGFNKTESELILDAILSHRSKTHQWQTTIAEYIFRADKLSRYCRNCVKLDECDWKLKNIEIEY